MGIGLGCGYPGWPAWRRARGVGVLVSRVCLSGRHVRGSGIIKEAIKYEKITMASNYNGGGLMVGVWCMELKVAGSNLAVDFDFFVHFSLEIFLSFW
jgi:hypothetical protein